MPVHYDPTADVQSFVSTEPLGRVVLSAYDEADPLQCGGWGVPDEYLGYAKKFVESLRASSFMLNESLRAKVWSEFLRELVHRSFGPTQIAEGWVALESIEAIAQAILLHVPPGEYLVEVPPPDSTVC